MDSANGGRVRGRFGITRDADGSLSVLHGWPWFWRYPVAVAASGAAWLYLASFHAKAEWLSLAIGGCVALVLLTVVYELALALLGIGVLAGLYFLVTSSDGGFAATAQVVAATFLVIGVWTLLQRSDESKKALTELAARLADIEQRIERVHYDVWRAKQSRDAYLGGEDD